MSTLIIRCRFELDRREDNAYIKDVPTNKTAVSTKARYASRFDAAKPVSLDDAIAELRQAHAARLASTQKLQATAPKLRRVK